MASHLQSNQLRALAVRSDKRFPVMPDVPTAKELGYNVSASQMMGVLAPKGTPPEIVDTLVKALAKMVKDRRSSRWRRRWTSPHVHGAGGVSGIPRR